MLESAPSICQTLVAVIALAFSGGRAVRPLKGRPLTEYIGECPGLVFVVGLEDGGAESTAAEADGEIFAGAGFRRRAERLALGVLHDGVTAA